MTFREHLNDSIIYESFDIHNNYKKLSKTESNKYWYKILDIENESDDFKNEIIKNLNNKFKFLENYYIKNEGREYLIYSYYTNAIFEVHFYDLNSVDSDSELENLNLTKSSMYVFSTIISIIIKNIENKKLNKIRIQAPKNKEDLYLKIIKKILKKYNIDKDITIKNTDSGKDYLIEFRDIKMCPWNISQFELNENKNVFINNKEIINKIKTLKLKNPKF